MSRLPCLVPNDDWIAPGEESDVEVQFLLVNDYVRPGFRWLIQEGSRVVGSGEVLEVIYA